MTSLALRKWPFSSGSERMVMRSAPFGPFGGGFRHAVVDGAEVLVDLHRLEAGWRGILQVLNDPHAARVVEGDRDRLTHVRLGSDELDFESVGDFHALEGVVGREALGGEPAGADGADQRGGEAGGAETGHGRVLGGAGRRRGAGSGIQGIVRRGGRRGKRDEPPIRGAGRKAVRPTPRATGVCRPYRGGPLTGPHRRRRADRARQGFVGGRWARAGRKRRHGGPRGLMDCRRVYHAGRRLGRPTGSANGCQWRPAGDRASGSRPPPGHGTDEERRATRALGPAAVDRARAIVRTTNAVRRARALAGLPGELSW